MSYYDYKNLSPEQKATYQTLSILETSANHQAKLQAAERAAFEKEKSDAENEKLLAKHRDERERELAAEAEQRRKENAARFEQSLRERFFAGNEFASEADFQKVLPKMRESVMLKNAETQETTENLMRKSGNYSRM